MMRKTALLSGVAGLFLMTAPAFAQDTAAQTPPAPPPGAQPASLQLSPGMVVRGSDGSELGRLEGVRSVAGGQEITVRGADGQLRGVPTAGIGQQGQDVTVAWSSAQFSAAAPIADAAPPAPEAGPEPAPASATTAPPASAPVEPPTTAPMSPPNPAPATEPSTAPAPDAAPPPPGEGQAEPDKR